MEVEVSGDSGAILITLDTYFEDLWFLDELDCIFQADFEALDVHVGLVRSSMLVV